MRKYALFIESPEKRGGKEPRGLEEQEVPWKKAKDGEKT